MTDPDDAMKADDAPSAAWSRALVLIVTLIAIVGIALLGQQRGDASGRGDTAPASSRSSTMAIHDRVDLAQWVSMFPLDQLRARARDFVEERARQRPADYRDQAAKEKHIKLMSPGGEIITSPHDLAVVEQLRKEVFAGGAPSRSVSTDVFIFGAGEPSKRESTKVGGLPYRAAGKPWPRRPTGDPLVFVGQLCFADSKDLVGDLPGDVLLIFVHEPSYCSPLEFEWVTIGEADPLVQAAEIPAAQPFIEPVFGVVHRTSDYPDDRDRFRHHKMPYTLDVLEGTKIGGVPRWIQGDESPGGRFLGTLGPIQPAADKAYPFVNVGAPIPLSELHKRRDLMFGDMGSIYLFFDGQRTHGVMQCY
jgi:hypothetical protein